MTIEELIEAGFSPDQIMALSDRGHVTLGDFAKDQGDIDSPDELEMPDESDTVQEPADELRAELSQMRESMAELQKAVQSANLRMAITTTPKVSAEDVLAKMINPPKKGE